MASGQVPHSEPGHERGHNESDRVNVGTRKENQHALPDHLIEQSRKTGEKEDRESDPTMQNCGRLYKLLVSHRAISRSLWITYWLLVASRRIRPAGDRVDR